MAAPHKTATIQWPASCRIIYSRMHNKADDTKEKNINLFCFKVRLLPNPGLSQYNYSICGHWLQAIHGFKRSIIVQRRGALSHRSMGGGMACGHRAFSEGERKRPGLLNVPVFPCRQGRPLSRRDMPLFPLCQAPNVISAYCTKTGFKFLHIKFQKPIAYILC